MRIAICLCGQARTWRTSVENIKHFFHFNAEVDYFIHTWDTNTYKSVDYKIEDTDLELFEIKKAFNPKSIILDKYEKDIDGYGWKSYFKSFMKSVWLKKNYELENDFVYDIVIKARFDIVYPPDEKFELHLIQPMALYSSDKTFIGFPSEFKIPMINDVIFYSDSPTMDIISKTYIWIKKYIQDGNENENRDRRIEDVTFYCSTGSILYMYLVKWNILPTYFKHIKYYAIRKNMENLNCDTEWDKIIKLDKEHYD